MTNTNKKSNKKKAPKLAQKPKKTSDPNKIPKRYRNWAMVIYPESVPENWKQILDDLHVKGVRILHDKDVNPDGTNKKAHWHVVLMYSGPKSYSQIKEITDMLHAPAPQAIKNGDPAGYLRYLTHMDNPEKYQYSTDDLQFFGGFTMQAYLNIINDSGTKEAILQDIIHFIINNHYTSISALTRYCMDNDKPDWESIIINSNTYTITVYLKDQYQQQQHAEEERQKLIDQHERESFEETMSKKQKTLYMIQKMDKKGISQKEIAETLGISVRTVRRYLRGQ